MWNKFNLLSPWRSSFAREENTRDSWNTTILLTRWRTLQSTWLQRSRDIDVTTTTLHGACFVLAQSSLFEVISGHLTFGMLRRHRLTKVCNLFLLVFVVRHVSEPYSMTDLTSVLNILILLWSERAEDRQMGVRVLKTCLALLMRLLMS